MTIIIIIIITFLTRDLIQAGCHQVSSRWAPSKVEALLTQGFSYDDYHDDDYHDYDDYDDYADDDYDADEDDHHSMMATEQGGGAIDTRCFFSS